MNLGVLASLWIALVLLPRRGTNLRSIGYGACALAAAAMGYCLALVSAPSPDWARILGFFRDRHGSGVVEHESCLSCHLGHLPDELHGYMINLAGTFFGVGCLSTALFICVHVA